MISAVSLAAAAFRSTQNSCAPSRAKVTAVALPLPQPGPIEPAPTTIAVLPLRRSTQALPVFLKLAGRGPAVNPSRRPRFALATTLFPAYAEAANRPVRGRCNPGERHNACLSYSWIIAGCSDPALQHCFQ